MVNNSIILDRDGIQLAPKEAEYMLVPKLLEGIPLPEITTLRAGGTLLLFGELEKRLPRSTYMAAVMLGGEWKLYVSL